MSSFMLPYIKTTSFYSLLKLSNGAIAIERSSKSDCGGNVPPQPQLYFISVDRYCELQQNH